jgi:hypothetical protein
MAGSPTSITEIISRLTKHFTLGSTATSETTLDALQAPPALRAAWSISSEWHQLPSGHYNAFGFNLLSPPAGLSLDDDENATGIFGGLDLRRQWASYQRERDGIDVSCADEGWVVIAAFSEYDFLFCCLDPKKARHYGKIRHIVNNCSEEADCCGSGEELLGHVATFVEEAAAMSGGIQEFEEYMKDNEIEGLNHSLARLRFSMLDVAAIR